MYDVTDINPEARWRLNDSTATLQITFDFLFVVLWPVQVHGCGVPVQRVDGVRVGQQLWQKRLEDVGEICEERESEEVAFNTGAEQKSYEPYMQLKMEDLC